jgi:hypothetical protein
MAKILSPPYKNGPNLNHPTKMPKFEIPIPPYSPDQKNIAPYNKMTFSRTPYIKMALLRPPYTTNWHFQDPIYNKMTFIPPPHFQME